MHYGPKITFKSFLFLWGKSLNVPRDALDVPMALQSLFLSGAP